MEDNKLNVVNVSSNKVINNVENKKQSNKNFLTKLIKNATMQINKKSPNKSENSSLNNTENTEKIKDDKKVSFISKILKNNSAKVAIIVLIFSVCALLILNSSFGTSVTNTTVQQSNSNFTSSLQFCEQLETKLKNVLSKINGVGNVSVMVSVKSAPELIIASSSNEKSNSSTAGNGSQTNTIVSKDPVIITNSGVSSPLILTEKLPEITGVVIVAEGARDVKIKLSLLEAVQALLDVKSSNIQIYY